jgi:hypothetical protein
MVLQEGARALVEAGTVAGLFPGGVRQAASPAVALPQPVLPTPAAPQPEVKPCPFCGETVPALAKKCKHCGEPLDVALRAAEEARSAAEAARGEASALAPSNTVAVNAVQEVRHEAVEARYAPSKSPGVAAVLEVVGGGLFATFGVGHIYAGSVGLGLLIMFGCWFVFFINILLCFAVIGFLTLPLCWLVAMIVCPTSAAHCARSG